MSKWNLDFKGDTPEVLDAGGKVVPGFYKARFTGEEVNQTNGASKMIFEIVGGGFNGQKVNRTLWNPRFSDTQEKAQGAMKHAKSWAWRMNLCKKEDITSGKQIEIDFDAAIGREFIIEVVAQKDRDTGKPGIYVEVAYLGVWGLDHPEIPAPNAVRPALGLPLLKEDVKPKGPAAGGREPVAPPKDMAAVANGLWK